MVTKKTECIEHDWVDTFKEPTQGKVNPRSQDASLSPESVTYIQHQECSICKQKREVQQPSGVVRAQAQRFITPQELERKIQIHLSSITPYTNEIARLITKLSNPSFILKDGQIVDPSYSLPCEAKVYIKKIEEIIETIRHNVFSSHSPV